MALTDDGVMELRREFPALRQTLDGRSIAFFDGPGGTQVHGSVIDAIARYYTEANSNAHGAYEFSRRTDETVAVGAASNAVGTVNDVRRIAKWAHAVDAWIYVDAVQYAPHAPIDVQALDVDFLAFSTYKLFGPHLGVLWGRYALLDALPAYKVVPAEDAPPDKSETGTPNFEGMAGATAAVDYLASVGRRFGALTADTSRREEIVAGMSAIRRYERALAARLVAGLETIRGVRIYGITDPSRFDERMPVVSFTLEEHAPSDVARRLDDEAIFVWSGDFYAVHVIERLGLTEAGGLVRIGINHYNTENEVDRLLAAIEGLAP